MYIYICIYIYIHAHEESRLPAQLNNDAAVSFLSGVQMYAFYMYMYIIIYTYIYIYIYMYVCMYIVDLAKSLHQFRRELLTQWCLYNTLPPKEAILFEGVG